MSSNHNHRHNATAPIGMILFKLALGVGAALLQKKLVDKIASKPPTPPNPPEKPEQKDPPRA